MSERPEQPDRNHEEDKYGDSRASDLTSGDIFKSFDETQPAPTEYEDKIYAEYTTKFEAGQLDECADFVRETENNEPVKEPLFGVGERYRLAIELGSDLSLLEARSPSGLHSKLMAAAKSEEFRQWFVRAKEKNLTEYLKCIWDLKILFPDNYTSYLQPDSVGGEGSKEKKVFRLDEVVWKKINDQEYLTFPPEGTEEEYLLTFLNRYHLVFAADDSVGSKKTLLPEQLLRLGSAVDNLRKSGNYIDFCKYASMLQAITYRHIPDAVVTKKDWSECAGGVKNLVSGYKSSKATARSALALGRYYKRLVPVDLNLEREYKEYFGAGYESFVRSVEFEETPTFAKFKNRLPREKLEEVFLEAETHAKDAEVEGFLEIASELAKYCPEQKVRLDQAAQSCEGGIKKFGSRLKEKFSSGPAPQNASDYLDFCIAYKRLFGFEKLQQDFGFSEEEQGNIYKENFTYFDQNKDYFIKNLCKMVELVGKENVEKKINIRPEDWEDIINKTIHVGASAARVERIALLREMPYAPLDRGELKISLHEVDLAVNYVFSDVKNYPGTESTLNFIRTANNMKHLSEVVAQKSDDKKLGGYASEIFRRLQQEGADTALGKELEGGTVSQGFEDPLAHRFLESKRAQFDNVTFESLKQSLPEEIGEAVKNETLRDLELCANQPKTTFQKGLGNTEQGWKYFLLYGSEFAEFSDEKSKVLDFLEKMQRNIDLIDALNKVNDWKEQLHLLSALRKLIEGSQIDLSGVIVNKTEIFKYLKNPGFDITWTNYLRYYEAAILLFGKDEIENECNLRKHWSKILAEIEHERNNSSDFVPFAALAQRLCPKESPYPKVDEREYIAYKDKLLESYKKNKNAQDLIYGVVAVKGLRVHPDRDEL